MPTDLHRLDVLALLALERLGDDAYGVTVSEDIASNPSTRARAAVVRGWLSEPRPERGGRARRYFAPTRAGREALRAERALATKMWQGVALPGKDGRR